MYLLLIPRGNHLLYFFESLTSLYIFKVIGQKYHFCFSFFEDESQHSIKL